MDLKKDYETLKATDEFKKFKDNEDGFVLAHAFMSKELGKESHWDFGFYHKGRDRIVVFETRPIKRSEEQEVFKKEGDVKPINLEEVEISYENAMQICENIRKDKYSSEVINKYIIILQNLHKQLWNITLITKSFNMINIRIDSKSGEIISDNKRSIMDLGLNKI